MERLKNELNEVTDIIQCLEGNDCRIKKVKESDDNVNLVVATKRYDSKVFKFNIEYHAEDEIVYLATQCEKAVPSKKYHLTVDVLNRLSLTHIRVGFALCSKTLRMTCFDVVPFTNYSGDEITIEIFNSALWYGMRSLNDISKSIKINDNLEDIMKESL